MRDNKYELRSKDIQEVMKNPPSRLLVWGNTMIILILIVAILIADQIYIPETISFPCKLLENHQLKKYQNVTKISVLIAAPMPKSVKPNMPAVFQINNIANDLGRFSTSISYVDRPNHTLVCIIPAKNSGSILSNSKRIFILNQDVSGTIQITTGTISIMQLFLRRVTNF